MSYKATWFYKQVWYLKHDSGQKVEEKINRRSGVKQSIYLYTMI